MANVLPYSAWREQARRDGYANAVDSEDQDLIRRAVRGAEWLAKKRLEWAQSERKRLKEAIAKASARQKRP